MGRILLFIILLIILQIQNTIAKYRTDEPLHSIEITESDSLKLVSIWKKAVENGLENKSLIEIELVVAQWFTGTPYLAGTLDKGIEEKLVINLQELDCVTYVETVIALSQTINGGILTNEAYFRNLENLRYRNGKMDGYASRLHYFSEWLLNNQQKGILTLPSDSLGNVDLNLSVNIISKNRNKNAHLGDSSVFAEIVDTEREISSLKLRYITKQYLPTVEPYINNGDIIAISTSIKGLDVVHTGIAIKKDNKLFMMHASSTMGKVVISNISLTEYLQQKTSFTGVLIARLKVD